MRACTAWCLESVSNRLEPTREQRPPPLRLTISSAFVPLLGTILVLALAPVRSPLLEHEATIALGPLSDQTPPLAALLGTALLALGGQDEFSLRIFGVLVGTLVLAGLIRLGDRLFSNRAGVLAALVLPCSVAGRIVLGSDLGVAPFEALATVAALAAIRGFGVTKRSGLHAGVASGVAAGFAGPGALWLVVMAGLWMWKLRGLTLRNLLPVVIWTVLVWFGLETIAAQILLPGSLPTLAWISCATPVAMLPSEIVATSLAILVLLPACALGIWIRPPDWPQRGSPRFLAAWLGLAVVVVLAGGSIVPLVLGLALAAGVALSFALMRGRQRTLWIFLVLTAVGALALSLAPRPEIDRRADLDRWAVREAARFLRRNLPLTAELYISEHARDRISWYGRRLAWSFSKLDELPFKPTTAIYSLLPRRSLIETPAALREPLPRTIDLADQRYRVVAEFGPWAVLRSGGEPAEPAAPVPAASPDAPSAGP